MSRRTLRIIKKVCIAETLRQLRAGDSATFSCSTFGAYSSACVAVHRLNKANGYEEYEIETPDNGATYTVTRNFPKNNLSQSPVMTSMPFQDSN